MERVVASEDIDTDLESRARDRAEELEARRAYSLLVQDRQRLAADLHDLVIQRLYACQLTLSADPGPATVEGVIDDLDEAIRELRTCIYELRTSADTTPLIERVRLILEGVARTHETELVVTGTPALIPDDIEGHLLAVVREAISNARRHADADRIEVAIHVDSAGVTMRIEDDGRGLDTAVIGRETSGLRNMRIRAEALGGTFETASDGRGTAVIWFAPIEAAGPRR